MAEKFIKVPKSGKVKIINETYALVYTGVRGSKLAIKAEAGVPIESEVDRYHDQRQVEDPFHIGSRIFQITSSRAGLRIYVGENRRDCIEVVGKNSMGIDLKITSDHPIRYEEYARQDPAVLLWHIRNRARAKAMRS